VGDEAIASLISRVPARDARMESRFSFLRSRSTCQDASDKSSLDVESAMCRGECKGTVTMGSKTLRLGRAHASVALNVKKCSWKRMKVFLGPLKQRSANIFFSKNFRLCGALQLCHNYSVPLL
jgi:hypothetical protein